METRKKRLLQKRSRYQELYANDLISMEELKEKLAGINEALRALELEKPARPAQLRSRDGEIRRFLELETVTNADMRRLIDHIAVSRDGNVHVVLRSLG